MKYLLKNKEDINNVFIINPYESMFFQGKLDDDAESLRIFNLSTRKYRLPKSEESIYNSIKFYDEESSRLEIEKDYDKILMNLTEYEQTIAYAILDFRTLDRLLNKSVFEDELKNYVSESQKYFIKEDVDYDVLNSDTDFQIKHYLSLYLNDLEESIKLINSLKLNKIQKLVGESYIASYNQTIDYINTTYNDYIPKIEDDSLYKIILHNRINKLITIESDLIKGGYITKLGSKLYWNSKRGFKVKLVKFCRLLQAKGYIKEHIETGKVIVFFEDRYNISVGDQRKKSKFNETDNVIIADFYFIKF